MRKAGTKLDKKQRRLINVRDIILIFVVLILCFLIIFIPRFFSSDNSKDAVILLGGEEIYRVSLTTSEDRTFILDEVPGMEFEIKDHKIGVIHSDCPDKVCVRTGFIDKSTQVIVCLPNRITVKIVDKNTDSIDIVV